jgi:hypothetical protein
MHQVVYMKRLANRTAPKRAVERAWEEVILPLPPSVVSEGWAELEGGLIVVCDDVEVLEALDAPLKNSEADEDGWAVVELVGGAVRGPPSGRKGISKVFSVSSSQSLTRSEANFSANISEKIQLNSYFG